MEVSGIRQKWKILMATKAPPLSPATMNMSGSVGGMGLFVNLHDAVVPAYGHAVILASLYTQTGFGDCF